MPAPRTPGGLMATPRQLSLIAALGVALAGVLIAQFGGGSASPEPTASAGANPTARAAAATAGQTKVPAPPLASARNQRDTVALIGNCTVRVGDVIEGYRVQSIDAGGVRLVPSNYPAVRKQPRR